MTVNPKVNPKKLRPYDEPPKRRRALIPGAPDSAATGFLVAALVWLAMAMGLGVLAADMRFMPFELSFPFGVFDLGFELNQRRVDTAFVNAVVYGWLTNAGFAAIAFMTPRLVGKRLVAEQGLVLALLVWNLSLLGGIAALYVFDPGPTQALTAFPWLIDGGLAFATLIITGAFLATVGAAARTAYISLWFAGVGLLALLALTSLSATIGLLDFVLDLGDFAVALSSVFIERALLLLWLLPMAYASLYYVVPRASGHALESSGLALMSWVAWLVTAPVATLAAVVDTQVPYFVTSAAGAASMALLLPAALTAVNLVLTTRPRWTLLFGTGPVAFATVALGFLLAASMLDAIGTLRSVRDFVGGTDWARGTWTWAVLGAFTLAALAFAQHALGRVLRREWGSTPLSAAQLWCVFGGVTIAGLALMGAGMAEGAFRSQAADPDTIAAGLLGYQLAAFVGMGIAALGGLAALVNVFLAYTTGEPADYVVPGQPATAAAGH
jgi:cytochrome c oxidase cbb3-type subunit 1